MPHPRNVCAGRGVIRPESANTGRPMSSKRAKSQTVARSAGTIAVEAVAKILIIGHEPLQETASLPRTRLAVDGGVPNASVGSVGAGQTRVGVAFVSRLSRLRPSRLTDGAYEPARSFPAHRALCLRHAAARSPAHDVLGGVRQPRGARGGLPAWRTRR